MVHGPDSSINVQPPDTSRKGSLEPLKRWPAARSLMGKRPSLGLPANEHHRGLLLRFLAQPGGERRCRSIVGTRQALLVTELIRRAQKAT